MATLTDDRSARKHGPHLKAALRIAFVLWAATMGAPAAADGFPALAPVPPIERLFGLPAPAAGAARALHLPLVTREAEANGLPPAVADAVAQVESSYASGAVGEVGELGLMQVRPATAAMLGHAGSAGDLLEPAVNIRFGVLYLAKAWRLTGGDLCRTLMKYRAGHREERMTPLSAEYCRRARRHLAAIGSPLATGAEPVVTWVPPETKQATKLAPRSAPRVVLAKARARPAAVVRTASLARGNRPASIRSARDSRRFWAAHEARIKAINARLAFKRIARL